MNSTKSALTAHIGYVIDDLLCDPSISVRQRAELIRFRRRFTEAATPTGRKLRRHSMSRTGK